jgi:hypothetical protein
MNQSDFVEWFNSYPKVRWFDDRYLELIDDELLIHRETFMGWALERCEFKRLSEHRVYIEMGSRYLECSGIPLARIKLIL